MKFRLWFFCWLIILLCFRLFMDCAAMNHRQTATSNRNSLLRKTWIKNNFNAKSCHNNNALPLCQSFTLGHSKTINCWVNMIGLENEILPLPWPDHTYHIKRYRCNQRKAIHSTGKALSFTGSDLPQTDDHPASIPMVRRWHLHAKRSCVPIYLVCVIMNGVTRKRSSCWWHASPLQMDERTAESGAKMSRQRQVRHCRHQIDSVQDEQWRIPDGTLCNKGDANTEQPV